jgi:hypothetical protein
MVPKWAEFFTQEKYDEFIDLVRQYLKKQKLEIKDYANEGYLIVQTSDSDSVKLGLTNLAKKCRAKSRSKWKSFIKDYFDHVFKYLKKTEEFARRAQDFKFAKKYIGVQVYPSIHSIIERGMNIGYKVVMDDIGAIIVFVHPEGRTSINFDNFPNWSKDIDELFAIGHANIKKRYQVKFEEVAMGDQLTFLAAETDHSFATNIIFDLDNRPELVGKYGSIMAFPNRDLTLAYPIQATTPAVKAFLAYKEFVLAARRFASEHPGRISDDAYWFHAGEFTCLSHMVVTKDSKQIVTLIPPTSFQELLNELDSSGMNDLEKQ